MKKKVLSLFIALFLIFICGAVFTACDDPEATSGTPVTIGWQDTIVKNIRSTYGGYIRKRS